MDKIEELEKDIKLLKVQGATNVALATLEGIKHYSQRSTDTYGLRKVAMQLAFARPTEPLAQNAVRFIFGEKGKSASYYLEKAEEYKLLISGAKEKMASHGLSLIRNGGVYLTHCHSSTVVKLFTDARREGKSFSVITTETRPLFQGRITAKELLSAGFEDVVHIIDNAAVSLIAGNIQHVDGVFIGADLLSSTGFVNKIGSLGIVLSAEMKKISLYCMSILLKYDPRPFSYDIIEKRSAKEIWPDAPPGVSFYTPAFDYIPYGKNIKIVSEKGIITGENIAKTVYKWYPFLKEEKYV